MNYSNTALKTEFDTNRMRNRLNTVKNNRTD